jgi:hypothetical protein
VTESQDIVSQCDRIYEKNILKKVSKYNVKPRNSYIWLNHIIEIE